MHKIEIKYKQFKFIPRKLEVLAPSEPSELSEEQFLLFVRMQYEKITDLYFLREFLFKNKNKHSFLTPHSSFLNKLTDFEIYNLTEIVVNALNIEESNKFFIKKIGGVLYTPSDKLGNVTFEQFCLFDTFFYDYTNAVKNRSEEKEKILAKFVAALCLKNVSKRHKPIMFEDITKIDFDKRVEIIKDDINYITQLALYINYIYIKNWLSKSFPFVFEKADDNKKQQTETNKQQSKHLRPDWNAIIDTIVGDDILKYDDYVKLPCIQVFKLMNRRMKEYKNKTQVIRHK